MALFVCLFVGLAPELIHWVEDHAELTVVCEFLPTTFLVVPHVVGSITVKYSGNTYTGDFVPMRTGELHNGNSSS